jgi:1-acyl-sn-glycerol-3-phosphate acyltransferase
MLLTSLEDSDKSLAGENLGTHFHAQASKTTSRLLWLAHATKTPGRRGTAHIIKDTQPIVVPVVVDGFRRAFDKKGLFIKKRNTTLSLTFKKPLELHPDEDPQALLDRIMDAIEQSPSYRPQASHEE